MRKNLEPWEKVMNKQLQKIVAESDFMGVPVEAPFVREPEALSNGSKSRSADTPDAQPGELSK